MLPPHWQDGVPSVSASISLHPIEDGAVLLDLRDKRLLTLNNSSAFLWCCLEDGLSLDSIINEYSCLFGLSREESCTAIDRALAAFDELHLLADGVVHEVEEEEDVVSARGQNGPVETPSLRKGHHFRILDTVFDVTLPTAELRDKTLAVIGGLQADAEPGEPVVRVTVGAENFQIEVGGAIVERCSDEAEVVPALKSALLLAAVNRTRYAGCFHAALLGTAAGAVLLPGSSGSGKTCLALALTRRGHAYLADEMVLLDPSTLAVRGVPMPACVKSEAWSMIAALYPELNSAIGHRRVDGKHVKYVTPTACGAAPTQNARRLRPIASMIFPTYVPGGATRISPLPQLEVLARLFANCNAWAEPLTPEFVDRLTRWLPTIRCYELIHADLSEAAALVETVLRSPS
jgi:hypothetical protein